ncbi:hypothetical protein CA830_32600, partial [Burkholderia multivorans]
MAITGSGTHPSTRRGAAIALALALCATLAGCDGRQQDRPASDGGGADAAASANAATIARGRYLALAGDCSACHDAADHTPYAGGQPVNSP